MNRDIVRSFTEDMWGKGNLSLIDQYCANDYLGHYSFFGKLDRDNLRQQVKEFRTAFPDLKPVVEEFVGDGDVICYRFSVTATHTGVLQGITPTNKKVMFSGVAITHLKNGKIVEDYASWDAMGLLQQIGAVKLPEQLAKAYAAQPPEARV